MASWYASFFTGAFFCTILSLYAKTIQNDMSMSYAKVICDSFCLCFFFLLSPQKLDSSVWDVQEEESEANVERNRALLSLIRSLGKKKHV